MTFLNPIYLWFLPFILLPVIIHLLAKQKSTLIDFPSLKFLKLLEQDALRKFNVKQLILLILRTLMILLLILIFARPSLNIHKGFGIYTKTADLLIFVLDNTASNRSNFESISGIWLKEFSQNLEEKGIKVLFCGLTDLELKAGYETITPGYGNAMTGDYNQLFGSQIDLDQYKRKSIVWLGDGQDVQDQYEYLADWEKYLLITRITNDQGIALVDLPERGIRQGEVYQVRFGVERAADDHEIMGVELVVNNKRENRIAIESEVSFAELGTRVNDPGFQIGQLEIGLDGHPFNNTRHFILPAAGNIPVQILSSNQSTDYWRIFKSSVKEADLNLEIHLFDFGEIDNLNLSEGGTIIIDDAGQVSDYNWNRLKTFMEIGGQLILFGNGGEQMQNMLKFESPLAAESSQVPFGLYLTKAGEQSLQLAPLEVVISQGRLKVFQRFNTGSGELKHTWIRFLDKQPFLGASDWKNGRVVWFNTDFGSESTNLTFQGIFPTLMLQFCQAQELEGQTDRYNVNIGDTLHFIPDAHSGGNTPFSIQRPDGIVEYQAPDSNYVIHYSKTSIPGIYNLMRGRKVLQPVAVNISTVEAQAHSKNYQFDETKVLVRESQGDLINEILERRSGQALWPILLSILLLLWVVETYLSRIKRTWRQNV